MSGPYWEPWRPEIGQRVRVNLGGECRTTTVEERPSPLLNDDALRGLMLDRAERGVIEPTGEQIAGHDPALHGVVGTVTDICRDDGMAGHYYRVMFDRNVMPGDHIGADMAAIELEPIGPGEDRS